jgi:signal transduction histidine kinase
LTTENINLLAELNESNTKSLTEIDLYKDKLEYNLSSLEAHKISYLETNNLLSEINSNIKNSLVKITELTKELIQSRSDEGFRLTAQEEIELLNEIDDKLAYVSHFCVVYKNEDVDVEAVISSCAKIYTKDIFLKNINFHSSIKGDLGIIKFNQLLFQQIIVSLLYVSFESARPKGEITLEAYQKKIKNKKMESTKAIISK